MCGQKVFSSEHKYPSHCGWATFYNTADASSNSDAGSNTIVQCGSGNSGVDSGISASSCVERAIDTFDGLVRTEVKCSKVSQTYLVVITQYHYHRTVLRHGKACVSTMRFR